MTTGAGRINILKRKQKSWMSENKRFLKGILRLNECTRLVQSSREGYSVSQPNTSSSHVHIVYVILEQGLTQAEENVFALQNQQILESTQSLSQPQHSWGSLTAGFAWCEQLCTCCCPGNVLPSELQPDHAPDLKIASKKKKTEKSLL